MSTTFVQTDANGDCSAALFCSPSGSGWGVAPTPAVKKAIEGGTQGPNNVTVVVGPSNGTTKYTAIYFEIVPGAEFAEWAEGIYGVTLYFPTLLDPVGVTWEACCICRLNSGCQSLEQLGLLDNQGQDIPLNSTLSMLVACNGVPAPASTDKIMVICAFANASGSDRNVIFRPSYNIGTPLSKGSDLAVLRRRMRGY